MEGASAAAEAAQAGVRRTPRMLRLASDARLVALVRDGDEAAFEALYDRHHAAILGFCRHMLGSREEAEDALQHTFLAAFRDLARSTKPIELRPWLFAIARNRCLSLLRARRQHVSIELADPSTDGLGATVERREDVRELLADLARLPEDQRAALLLSELGALDHAGIAQVLGCPREKVKALVFQARTSLAASREARATPCEQIRLELANATGAALRRGPLRRHLRTCAGCRAFKAEVATQRKLMALALPVVPGVALKAGVLAGAGGGAGSGSGASAAAADAMASAGAASGAGGAGALTGSGVGVGAGGALAGGAPGGALSGVLGTVASTGAAKAAVSLALAGAVAGGGVLVAHHERPARAHRSAATSQFASPSGSRAPAATTGATGIGRTSQPVPARSGGAAAGQAGGTTAPARVAPAAPAHGRVVPARGNAMRGGAGTGAPAAGGRTTGQRSHGPPPALPRAGPSPHAGAGAGGAGTTPAPARRGGQGTPAPAAPAPSRTTPSPGPGTGAPPAPGAQASPGTSAQSGSGRPSPSPPATARSVAPKQGSAPAGTGAAAAAPTPGPSAAPPHAQGASPSPHGH